MLRRVLATFGMVGTVLAVSFSGATPASAEIQRCSPLEPVIDGVTIESCITVNLSIGEARTRVSYNLTAPKNITVCTAMNRDSARQYVCDLYPNVSGIGAFDHKVGAGNPAGTQRWFSESYVGYAATRSPNVYDT